MPDTPAPTSPDPDFQPAFKRVAQSSDLDDLLACVAMLANKPLLEVRKIAVEKLEVPEHGSWWLSEDLLKTLAGHFNWFTGVYREVTKISELPDLCLLLVNYKENTARTGRHVLFHRQKAAAGVEYIIDPAYWVTEPSKQIRMDIKSLPPPLWYIGVHALRGGNK